MWRVLFHQISQSKDACCQRCYDCACSNCVSAQQPSSVILYPPAVASESEELSDWSGEGGVVDDGAEMETGIGIEASQSVVKVDLTGNTMRGAGLKMEFWLRFMILILKHKFKLGDKYFLSLHPIHKTNFPSLFQPPNKYQVSLNSNRSGLSPRCRLQKFVLLTSSSQPLSSPLYFLAKPSSTSQLLCSHGSLHTIRPVLPPSPRPIFLQSSTGSREIGLILTSSSTPYRMSRQSSVSSIVEPARIKLSLYMGNGNTSISG